MGAARSQRSNWTVLAFVAVIAASYYLVEHQAHRTPPIPKDYTLPHDNFDSATMQQIQADLAQYQVADTVHPYAVYMVTGGLHVANPRVMGWDSDGNMTFGMNGAPGYTYDIREMAQSPLTWKKVIPHGKLNPKTKTGVTFTYLPTHWTKFTTKSGVYYKLNDKSQGPQYFFRKGKTYIIVVPFPQSSFPVGLMTHLDPLHNPVKK